MNLDGKVCIVTGAANGLGAAMAIGLADHGASIVAADRDAKGLRHTLMGLSSSGDAIAVEADMSKAESASHIVSEALGRFGRIDVVVNNAGTGAQIVRPDFITRPLKSWHVPPEKWRKIIEINALGPFYLCHAAIPHMLQQGWGRIVNVSTTWETMLRSGFASYGPSKAALESMSAGMARELEGSGITINTVIPGGPVDTAQVPDDIGVDRTTLLRPSVMNDLVVWLAGEDSDDISGRRFTASAWDASRSMAENIELASEPVAWPQLVKPLVMADRGNLS